MLIISSSKAILLFESVVVKPGVWQWDREKGASTPKIEEKFASSIPSNLARKAGKAYCNGLERNEVILILMIVSNQN